MGAIAEAVEKATGFFNSLLRVSRSETDLIVMSAHLPQGGVLLLFLASPVLRVPIMAQDFVLRAEFWAESEPVPVLPRVVGDKPSGPRVSENVARALLDEARWVFAGMVWGFEFMYVPYDKARRMDEAFEVTPRGEIPWGDPRLSISETRLTGTQLRAYVEYRPDAAGIHHRTAWNGAPYESAQGKGMASVAAGTEARFKAMDEAVKEALRALLRPIVKNKPREIRGVFAYAEAPRLVVSEGQYTAVIRIRVEVTEVRPYEVY